jgi:hypothetical protein
VSRIDNDKSIRARERKWKSFTESRVKLKDAEGERERTVERYRAKRRERQRN